MIEIINPFFLYALSFIGALGVIWVIKFSNNQTVRKLSPKNNLRQIIALILLTNFLVLAYLIIHSKFISHMLIDPGFIISNNGSGGGFFWNDDLGYWDQQKLKNYENYKFIKELIFTSINFLVFFLALFLRNRNNSKITTEISKKPNSAFSALLIFFSLILTIITLAVIMFTVEDLFLWTEG
jgi:hypothetical protein